MAVSPYRLAQILGTPCLLPTGTGAFTDSAAASWYAVSFVADSARTINTVRTYISATAQSGASVPAASITASLYDSTGTNGAPGALVNSDGPHSCSTTLNGAGWYNWTGFNTTLTAGQQYWIVFKNADATPASNNVSFRSILNAAGQGAYPSMGNSNNRMCWAKGSSINSGGTWSLSNNVGFATRIGYSDGSFDGVTISNAVVAGSGDGVYSARESGVKFTSPANVALKVQGLAMLINTFTGAPAAAPRLGLWTGSTPVNQGYGANLLTTSVTLSGIQWVYSYFPSDADVIIQPGTICRVTLGEATNSDTVSNYYANHEISWDTDGNSTILLPWDGTCVKTYYNGSSWVDSTLGTSIFSHGLILDTSGEFSWPGPVGQLVGARGATVW